MPAKLKACPVYLSPAEVRQIDQACAIIAAKQNLHCPRTYILRNGGLDYAANVIRLATEAKKLK